MSSALAPYVPRLVVDWLADEPQRQHRAVTGTLVFADISGFTALTERLAARGKAGAEEMGDILNTIFERLLTAAYDYGANLIKWGGDAVLLLFDEQRHAARACAAAMAMQDVMRREGRVETSTGAVRLGMSIGVHTGEVDFMLVGRRHRELIIAGPAVTTMAQMEKVADRGEVVLSPSTAVLLPSICRGTAKGDGVLLRKAPDIDQRPNRKPKRENIDVSMAFCSQLREHLRHGTTEYEHRTATVGFVELHGSDDLLAEQGPDALVEAVGHVVEAIQDAAADNDVTVLSSDATENGAKIIVISGVPVASGDDETRVLATLRRAVHPGGQLQLRAGITSGNVFAGDYGPFYRKTYSITGDIVNLAARLMAKAGPGQIVAIPDVVARSRTRFETSPMEPFHVKGKASPISAVIVGDVARTTERVTDSRPPLVGRDSELALLRELAGDAFAGNGQVAEIVGPAGMGKSRLTEELIEGSVSRVLWADGDIYARATPYQPMHQLLRRTLGISPDSEDADVAGIVVDLVRGSAPELEPWLPLIGIVAGVDLPTTPEVDILDPEIRRSRLESVASALLGSLLTTPTIFVFNDVHFMDDATKGLLRTLAKDSRDRPWLMMLTTRPDDESAIEGAQANRIVLQPLEATYADQLIRTASESAPLPAHRARQLVERAGGNPLFLEQLVAGALGGADLDELPGSVEGVIAARIDRLPAPRRQWLRAASVLGNVVDPRWLGAMLGTTGIAEISDLEEFIVEQPDSTLRFVHHMVRLTAYEGLSYRRRTELHARAADVAEELGTDRDAAVLSLHSFNGGRYEKAWRYACLAGDQARENYAPAEAAQLYRRAVSSASHLQALDDLAVADVYEHLARVELDLGEMPAAEAALKHARQRAKADAHRLARIRLKTAMQRQHTGRHADALRWVTRGRAGLRGMDDAEARRLLAELAERASLIRYDQGAYRSAMSWATTAVTEAKLAGDQSLEARTMGVYVSQAALAGLPVDESKVQAALELYQRSGDLRGLARASNTLGIWAYFAGHWDRAIEYYAMAEQASRTIGRDYDASAAAANQAEVLIQQRRFDEAEPVLLPALRAFLAANATSFLAFGLGLQGRIALSRGEYLQAADRFGEARRLCLEMGEGGEALAVEAHAAECLLQAGEREQALNSVAASLRDARGNDQLTGVLPQLHRVRGRALLALGRSAEGQLALREALAAARAHDTSYEIQACLRDLINNAVTSDEAEDGAWRAEHAKLTSDLGILE